VEELLAIPASECIRCSAKEGIGIEEILEAVVQRVPAPAGDPGAPTRALIFDSHFDTYLGIIAYVRVMDGAVRPGARARLMATGAEFEVAGVGVFAPEMRPTDELQTGEVGFLHGGIKSIGECRVGETVTAAARPAVEPLPGYKQVKPMVFCGLWPVDSDEYPDLREALSKLQLNDSSLGYEPESSAALGFGFRCGFLGLLHSEIIQERLEREFDLDLIATSPSVIYRVTTTDGQVHEIDNPTHWPAVNKIQSIAEPFVHATVIAPSEYVGTC